MNQKLKIGNLTVDCFVNEYNKKTKKQVQIPCNELTSFDKAAISKGLDDTDFGEFFRHETEDKIVTGMYNLIDSRDGDGDDD